jgi:hypothetical protein
MRIASIFRAEDWTLKVETLRAPQTLVNIFATSWSHNFSSFLTKYHLAKRLYGGLEDRETRFRFPTAVNLFFPLSRDQTASGLHPAFYLMDTAGSLPWDKAARGVKLTIYLQLVTGLRIPGKIPPFNRSFHDVMLNWTLENCKGKGSPYNEPWGPKRGSRGIALPFREPRHEEGMGWLAPRPGRFTPRKDTRYPLYRRLGGPQGRYGRLRKISPPPGFDPRTVQPVASRYTDWAILGHLEKLYEVYIISLCYYNYYILPSWSGRTVCPCNCRLSWAHCPSFSRQTKWSAGEMVLDKRKESSFEKLSQFHYVQHKPHIDCSRGPTL